MMTDTATEIDAYVRRLLWSLQALPQDDRLALASEIHDHLTESAARGADQLDRVLARLGAPDRLARAYVEEYELAGAVNRSRPLALLLAVLDRATGSLAAFGAGLSALILYLFAFSFAAIAISKLIFPANVGMWRESARTISAGIVPVAPASVELLGYWIVPLAVLLGGLCFLGAGRLLRAIGRRLLARPRPSLAG
jgi:uncharacterized membrane protein